MWQNRQRVDGIQIASPCSMSWNDMAGDERVRFCSACRLSVYNLSAMNVEEAASLISDGTAEVCVRLFRRPDGKVLTRDCPVGRQIVVRRKRAVQWGTLAASAGLVVSLQSSRLTVHRSERLGGVRPVAPTSQGRVEVEAPEWTPQMGSVAVSPPRSKNDR